MTIRPVPPKKHSLSPLLLSALNSFPTNIPLSNREISGLHPRIPRPGIEVAYTWCIKILINRAGPDVLGDDAIG